MPERFRTDLADARVFVALGDDVLLAARFDARQGELFTKNRRQFLHRQFDFEDVAARLIPGLRLPLALRRSQRLADLAFANADPAGVLASVAELRQLIEGSGMLTRSLPFLPIISPRQMYLVRLLFTLPRTIFRKR